MTYLELVRHAMREAGITMTDPEPTTLSGVTGITLKFKNWVKQAWEEMQIENDDSEFRRSWFATTVTPKFYFDLAAPGWRQPQVGDVLQAEFSNAQFTVTKVAITNGGTWAANTAQGFIEYSNLAGTPMVREQLKTTNVVGTPYACRFIEWGDYDLSNPLEMGDSYISDWEDAWWQTLKIQSQPSTENRIMNEFALNYIEYAKYMQVLDTGPVSPGFPTICTQSPQGRIALYPPPDETYNLRGFYTRAVNAFTNDSDTPFLLKPFYHPMLFWRAVQHYGDYEQQPFIAGTAKERYLVYKKRFDREERPPISMRTDILY